MTADKYQVWIGQHVPDFQAAYGKCAEVTLAMQAVFPELVRVRGQYHCLIWGERDHWWLTDPEGNIVDPTASQFPSGGLGEYVPHVEGAPEPTGPCMNCGGKCYDGLSACSEPCARELEAYYGCPFDYPKKKGT